MTVVLPRGLSPQECKAADDTSIHSLQHGIELFSHKNHSIEVVCVFFSSIVPLGDSMLLYNRILKDLLRSIGSRDRIDRDATLQ